MIRETFFRISRLSSLDVSQPSPLFVPLAPYPHRVLQYIRRFLSPCVEASSQWLLYRAGFYSAESHDIGPTAIPFSQIRSSYDVFTHRRKACHHSTPILILTDSSTSHGSSRGGGGRSIDKRDRVHIFYIRDGLDRCDLGFCSSGFNIADCGA